MTKILVKGDVYTVATKTECTVTSANGTPLGKATAGNPLTFPATTDRVELSDPDAEFVHINPKCAPVASGNSSGGNEEQITALSRNVGVLSERVRAQATALNIFGPLEGMMQKYLNVYYVETTLSLDVTSPTYFSHVLLRGVNETVEGTPFLEVTDLDGNATRYCGSRIAQEGTNLELFWDDLVPVANGYKLKITVEKAGKPVEFSVNVAVNAGSYPVWEIGYYTFALMTGEFRPTTTTEALSAVMSFFYETKAADPTLYPVAPTMKDGIIAPHADTDDAVAIGSGANAGAKWSTALGVNASALGESSIAIGDEASAKSTCGIAIGPLADAGVGSVALGKEAQASEPFGVAIGADAQVDGEGVMITYGNISDFDQRASEGEIVFCGAYQPSAYEGVFMLRIVPAFSDASVALFDCKPGIMVANSVINDVGTVIENMVRGATFEELFPRDILGSTAATPAAMSLEDEPAPLNPVQQFMQMVATIQARKQAAANS